MLLHTLAKKSSGDTLRSRSTGSSSSEEEVASVTAEDAARELKERRKQRKKDKKQTAKEETSRAKEEAREQELQGKFLLLRLAYTKSLDLKDRPRSPIHDKLTNERKLIL